MTEDLLGLEAEAVVEADREAALVRRVLELDDVKSVLASAPGRRMLRRLLEVTGVYRGTFTGDALTGAYNEGRRSIGIQLTNDITEADIEAIHTMMKEKRKEEEQNG